MGTELSVDVNAQWSHMQENLTGYTRYLVYVEVAKQLGEHDKVATRFLTNLRMERKTHQWLLFEQTKIYCYLLFYTQSLLH